MIRNVDTHDAAQIAAIYNHYITNTIITFEETPVAVTEMEQRIATVTRDYPWLVFEKAGCVIGYAYGNLFRTRCSYRHTLESTIYFEQTAAGRGCGTELYSRLLEILFQEKHAHCVLAGIALPNPASIALHEKFGFKQVAHLCEVGYKFNTWIDVGYWELMNPAVKQQA